MSWHQTGRAAMLLLVAALGSVACQPTPEPVIVGTLERDRIELTLEHAEPIIDIPTMDGAVKVRVPAGVQSGPKLRLSGRGAPSVRGDGRGDLFVVIQVVTPTDHDHRSREILRELGELHPENLREGQWPGVE